MEIVWFFDGSTTMKEMQDLADWYTKEMQKQGTKVRISIRRLKQF